MKKIIILFVAFFATVALAFGQPRYQQMKQALKIYEPKKDSVDLVYKNFCAKTQISVGSFNPDKKQYLIDKLSAFSKRADAVLYEIGGDEKHAKQYSELARQELSAAENFRKQKNISLSAQEDEYITLFCEIFFYYNIVETLYLNLKEKNLL